jgi:DNA-binding NtrC family response regulator
MVDNSTLKGARVLVIEDNALCTLAAKEMLAELGCIAVGTAASVEEARTAIAEEEPLDCVLLDVRLGHELSSEIASELLKRGLPFVISSGYGIKLPGMNIPVLDKPYSTETLGHALVYALGTAKAEQPNRIDQGV